MNAQFRPGEPVFHATFGSGAILSSEMRGETEYVRVHFEAGTKSLAAQYLARKEEDAGRARDQAHATVRPVPSQPQKAIRKRTVEPLRPFNAADFAREEMPSRRFLDERSLIPWEGVTLLFGDGATGKSLLLLQLMCGVARTTKFMGRRVDTGRAVYFSAEDTKAETHIRLGSIARHEGFTFDHLPDLDIHFMAGKDCVLGAVDRRTGIVQATQLFQQFRTDCLRRRPTLIGIDNLIDVFAGDVINPAQAKQFMHLLTGLSIECGCPVVLLAHPSKSGMSGGDGDGGTRAWSNSARARLYLQRVLTGGNHGEAPVEDDPDLRILSTKKANYGPAGTEIRLKWEDGRFVSMDEPPVGVRDVFGQALKAERVFLHLLRWHLEKGKTVSPNKSNAYAPTVFARHHKAEGIKARQFENVMNTLLDQNRIEIFTHGSPSSRRQHLGLPIGREEPDE